MPDSPSPSDRLGRLVAELRRRRVFRVAGAYVVVAWVLMQAGEIVFPAFELPNSTLRLLIVSLTLGLPLVVVLAWFFDVTPTGIRRARATADLPLDASLKPDALATESAERDDPPEGGGPSLEMILLGLVVPLVAFSILLAYSALRTEDSASPESLPAATRSASATPSLAVLPLEDLTSTTSDGGFFTRGMHEDILAHLSRVKSLKLISRTSVMTYEGTHKNIREIARELQVSHILEGSVRRTATHVRVTAQLIRTDTDEHIWARTFDAELEDVFAVQTEIAQAISSALEAEFSPATVEAGSGVVPAAYDAYLKARDLHRNLDANNREQLERIRHLYETALQADPHLAMGHLHIAILHAQARWFGFDPSAKRAEAARRSLDEAVRLGIEPDSRALAEGVLAYYLDRDFGKALLHFEDAVRLAPGDAEARFYRGMILRRSGELAAAFDAQKEALELDPLNAGYRDELALTLAYQGKLSEARNLLAGILANDPSRLRARLQKWQLDLELDGDPEALLEEISAAHHDGWQDPHYSMLEITAVLAGKPEVALEIIRKRPTPNPDSGFVDFQRATLEALAGNEIAKEKWLTRSRIKFAAFSSKRANRLPRLDRLRIEALFAFRSGDFDSAIAAQQQIVDELPVERDLISGSTPLAELLHFQLAAGRVEDATQSLRRLRERISLGSILLSGYFMLAEWPEFDAGRSQPVFASELERVLPDYARDWRIHPGDPPPA